MNTFMALLVSSAWLGILTSISPCPLATNIAAVSFLSRSMHSRFMAVLGAVAYSVGRATVYIVIGLFATWGWASAPELSQSLQHNIAPFVGPILILVALVLLGWLDLPLNFGLAGQSTAQHLAKWGLVGEFLLGALFALTFCPVSAALFFGAMLPLALKSSAPLFPLIAYGLGTALPVGIIAVSISFGFSATRSLIERIQKSQGVIQKISAMILMFIGVYLTLALYLNF